MPTTIDVPRDNVTLLPARRNIPDAVRVAFDQDDQYFPTPLQRFQFMDKYSRWSDELGRRETWNETVTRTVDFLRELSQNKLSDREYQEIHDAILNMQVMPSMRLLAMAGPAARRTNISLYNCSFVPVDSMDAFVEALLISMAGCGVGFSVESQFVHQLPEILHQKIHVIDTYVIEDSTEGWAKALRAGLTHWFNGEDIIFDYSLIRPHGAILKVKGGRASGPEPLEKMINFVRDRILARQGSTLRSIDAHDIMCEVGNAAVSGGVRRTAMISLFDENDVDMLTAKDGNFERENSQRWNANNSAVWTNVEHMDQQEFISRFMSMVRSGRGEPGIFSRETAAQMMPMRRRKTQDLHSPIAFGINPCGEINLRPWQFCNLSAVIARPEDTLVTLRNKVKIATLIGTIQSMATNFPGLRPQWQQNCEEERLLGVDITGQQDCPALTGDDGADIMMLLRIDAVTTNRNYAEVLGINPSTSITCVKPSGNTSVLVNCSSGLHARWSKYQIKRVRIGVSSPIYKVLKDSGVPMLPENGEDPESPRTWVVSFPVKAPDGAITRNDRSAVQQCEYWKRNKLYWTEHNPSVTITYRPHEIIDLMQWVWENRSIISGMSFLPSYDAQYDQLPNEEISESEYNTLMEEFPVIDWARIWEYESADLTTASQELACFAGGVCEL